MSFGNPVDDDCQRVKPATRCRQERCLSVTTRGTAVHRFKQGLIDVQTGNFALYPR
jgi:hypothetical protein